MAEYRFIEGFDALVSGKTIGKWDSGSTISSNATARFSGSAWTTNSTSSTGGAYKTLPINCSTILLSFALKFSALVNGTFLRLYDGSNVHVDLRIEGGKLRITQNGTVLQTSTQTFDTNQWRNVQLLVTIGTTGSYEVRVEGVSWLSGSSVNTKNASGGAYVNFFRLTACDAFASTNYDDLFLHGVNAGETCTFVADMRVETKLASGAGDLTQMAPSAGSNYQCVDDASTDDDSTFVEADVAGEADLYHFADFSTSGTIHCVQVSGYMRKTDAGVVTASLGHKVAATAAQTSPVSLNTSYTWHSEAFRKSPETTIDWTTSELNGTQWGTKRES